MDLAFPDHQSRLEQLVMFPVDETPEDEGHGDSGPPGDAERDYPFTFGEEP